ncbi:hypothetical protein S7711_04967 [Stachybotrys chartarum IBT 7711]|uniref:Fungal lipase-type domain-containing protein n=1 Tax=Stachybotrys chartarum (strain CBS 109288 / IBT 7711) TaxID=1280523 RepID=A0A084ARA0_STACB|nr:hypothetical protein S7711_04967 [Stachybotrys chartarum IBT 7711]KFA47882.1 hypothetical protein S40293_05138 [Stachybotrys chartarum IBT 40293]KFA73757.1 hypothetical protein S40288_07341 [Stachybotrys chartarum IBT 40288]
MLAYILLSFAALAAAAPLSATDYVNAFKARSLDGRAAVTEQVLADFRIYAEYAGAAYCNSEVAPGTAITCGGSAGPCPSVEGNAATVLQSFEGLLTGIGGYVAVDHARSEIIISIRGSNNLRNFLTDVVFIRQGCDLFSGCQVHAGFGTAWKEIESKATAAVAAAVAANPGYSVVATGHSLGGAVATIAAGYLRRSHAVDIYTFGAPRVGNAAFSQFITDQAGGEFRVTHVDDPVPRLPPMIFGYRHISPEYWLSTGDGDNLEFAVGDVIVCQGISTTGCNAGTNVGLNIPAHLNYIVEISSCGPAFSFRQASEVSDEELAVRLHEWALADQEYAAAINGAAAAPAA